MGRRRGGALLFSIPSSSSSSSSSLSNSSLEVGTKTASSLCVDWEGWIGGGAAAVFAVVVFVAAFPPWPEAREIVPELEGGGI